MEFKISEESHPLANRGDICFVNGNLVSVADDSVLKVHKVKNGALKPVCHVELDTSEHESLAIASNHLDKLLIGGKNKTINSYALG